MSAERMSEGVLARIEERLATEDSARQLPLTTRRIALKLLAEVRRQRTVEADLRKVIADQIGQLGQQLESTAVQPVAEKRTPEQWCAHYDVEIHDPDGWRSAGDPPWDQPLTLPDFWERASRSTLRNIVGGAWNQVGRDAHSERRCEVSDIDRQSAGEAAIRERDALAARVAELEAEREADVRAVAEVIAASGGTWMATKGAILQLARRFADRFAALGQQNDAATRCCKCSSSDVTYRNYLNQPFCGPCADGRGPVDGQHDATDGIAR